MRYLTRGVIFDNIADARSFVYRMHTSKYTSWKEEIYHINKYGTFLLGYVRYDGHRKELFWDSRKGTARLTKTGLVWY